MHSLLCFQDISEVLEAKNEETLTKLSSTLLSIAKRHESYKTMWDICCDLNNTELLRNLMVWTMDTVVNFGNFSRLPTLYCLCSLWLNVWLIPSQVSIIIC